MKTIKIFLASSEEMDNDRMAFGNLVRRLDDMPKLISYKAKMKRQQKKAAKAAAESAE